MKQIWTHPDPDRPQLIVTSVVHWKEIPEGYELEVYTIIDEWTTIDRWWATDSIKGEFRQVQYSDGRTAILKRENNAWFNVLEGKNEKEEGTEASG